VCAPAQETYGLATPAILAIVGFSYATKARLGSYNKDTRFSLIPFSSCSLSCLSASKPQRSGRSG